ncbi:MAG: right-handed parallel beta-helix repeat-containing protein [Planctomycetota bacterium]|jgi:hypothetical protein
MKQLLTMCVVVILALSTSVYAEGGGTGDGTLYVPSEYTTIAAALANADAGDTIDIAVGTYTEPAIHVNKSVTIEGSGIGSTFIQPTGVGFYVDADNVTIKDLTIQNGSQGVRFEMAGSTIVNTILERVEFLNNSSRGIEVHNATTVTNLLVNECNFQNCNIGLRVSSSGHIDGAEFRDSTFTSNSIGIYEANDGGSSTMKNVLIAGCTFTNHASFAIFLEEIQDAVIENNTFINNYRDIQIFKWYQASVPVSNVTITGNTMTGTTNAVFAIFNAHHISGQTTFDGVSFTNNTAVTNDGSAVYAGAHSNWQNATPSLGGLGWETVTVSCNNFLGITTPGNGVRFWTAGLPDEQALGGASIDVTNNWWGTADAGAVEALMHVPAITNYDPWLVTAVTSGFSCVGFEPPMDKGAVTVKKNRVLPLRAKLLGGCGYPVTDIDIIAPPVIQVIFESGEAEGTVDVTDQALSAGQGTEGNQFVYTGSNWQFNLKTKNYNAAGTYTVTMVSGDEDEYEIESTCEAVFVIE